MKEVVNGKENNQKSEVAKREEEILSFWNENQIFKKTEQKEASAGDFVFYDGPPFATGTPHFGHLLPTSLKDAIPRYHTMKGKRVIRRWGWDCHGLPVENIVEKDLDLKVKKDIENYGIDKFNQKAKESVLKYADVWRGVIPRMGRWVDMDNDYKTMEPTYTESIWWAFKNLDEKGLIYEGYKSMHLCPRCETTLSNFEVNQGYKDITDISVTVKFELVDEPGTYLLAWTTTPWTLPGNVALAVNPDIDYVKIKQNDETFVLAKDRLSENITGEYEVLEEVSGQNLLGLKYVSVFDYYQKTDIENKENGWQVYPADFVTTEDGTGIVHIAPAFGEDDMNLGREKNLPFIQHVSTDGRFKNEVADFAGLQVKPKDDKKEGGDHQSTDIEIIKNLAHRGLLFAKKKIIHSYPHCWRCETPLLNYASNSWFVKVTDIKDKLVAENKKVNWVPDHIKEGRFGNWLEGARDWAISRSRFWGAPLPVWRCLDCQKKETVGSIKEMLDRSVQNGNHFYAMRHGEADSNVSGLVSGQADNPHHLTEKGKAEVAEVVEKLKSEKIDLIFTSPFIRTKETADLVASALGLSPEQLMVDDRIAEVDTGDFNNRPIEEYRAYFKTTLEKFYKASPGGENLTEMKKRFGDFIYDIDNKYKDKKILIITHEYGVWMLDSVCAGLDSEQSAKIKDQADNYIDTGNFKNLNFRQIPHNADYELDLHRPYIDQVVFACDCGGKMERIKDIFDCWFESGSMPYAQSHYPFEESKDFDPSKDSGFPADFIAEGLDQTRGWFYSMLVLSTALFGKAPYKNVVVNGLIMAEDGRKMSKSLKNYPDINLTIDKYGADALRFFLLSSPAVHGDEYVFFEKALQETYRRVILRLENVFSFFETYIDKTEIKEFDESELSNVLDKWILSRLNQTIVSVEEAMEVYQLDRAVRPIDSFVDDLSTWYIRRSRSRFKSEDKEDRRQAVLTTAFVLKKLVSLSAPFIPFITESLYQKLKKEDEPESVHLLSWPKATAVDEDCLLVMKKARELVTAGLELRAKSNIKVRQPLLSLTISENLPEAYLSIIGDEVNVKKVLIDQNQKEIAVLNENITAELKKEGQVREFLRQIQDLRKKQNLKPSDKVSISISANKDIEDLLLAYKKDFEQIAGVSDFNFVSDKQDSEIVLEDFDVSVSLNKNEL